MIVRWCDAGGAGGVDGLIYVERHCGSFGWRRWYRGQEVKSLDWLEGEVPTY